MKNTFEQYISGQKRVQYDNKFLLHATNIKKDMVGLAMRQLFTRDKMTQKLITLSYPYGLQQ